MSVSFWAVEQFPVISEKYITVIKQIPQWAWADER